MKLLFTFIIEVAHKFQHIQLMVETNLFIQLFEPYIFFPLSLVENLSYHSFVSVIYYFIVSIKR